MLEKSVQAGKSDHWLGWLHLGVMYLGGQWDFDKARDAWEKSVAKKPNAWAYRMLAALATHEKNAAEAARLYPKAVALAPDNQRLVIECGRSLVEAGKAREWLEIVDTLPASRPRPRPREGLRGAWRPSKLTTWTGPAACSRAVRTRRGPRRRDHQRPGLVRLPGKEDRPGRRACRSTRPSRSASARNARRPSTWTSGCNGGVQVTGDSNGNGFVCCAAGDRTATTCRSLRRPTAWATTTTPWGALGSPP